MLEGEIEHAGAVWNQLVVVIGSQIFLGQEPIARFPHLRANIDRLRFQPAFRLSQLRLQSRDAALPLVEDRQFQPQSWAGYPLSACVALGIDAEVNRAHVAISFREAKALHHCA